MIKLTRAQREALHSVWLHHMQPESRNHINADWDTCKRTGKLTLHNPNGCEGVYAPDTPTYRKFRLTVVPMKDGSVVVCTHRPPLQGGMYICIEADGYTHS